MSSNPNPKSFKCLQIQKHQILIPQSNKKNLASYSHCMVTKKLKLAYTFFLKQSIFDPRSENCLSFPKNLPEELFSNCLLVDDLLTSID